STSLWRAPAARAPECAHGRLSALRPLPDARSARSFESRPHGVPRGQGQLPVKKLLAAAALATTLVVAESASATGYNEIGQDYKLREKTDVQLSGYMRTRGEGLYNLDMDRGLTPSGTPIFPVSQSDPKAQMLTHWDMRLRTDMAFYAPG